jgi:hypothetical protein
MKDTTGVQGMMRAEKHPQMREAQQQGLNPLYFTSTTRTDPSRYHDILISFSRRYWSAFGYTGLATPWHDGDLSMLNFQRKSFTALFDFLEREKIDTEAYCILVCVLSAYSKYERPALLYCHRPYWSWFSKLKKYAGPTFDEVAQFVAQFVDLQIEYGGVAYVAERNVLEKDAQGRYFLGTFHRIADRINQLKTLNIPWQDWLVEKFRNTYKGLTDHRVYLNTIVNLNGFDPKVGDLKLKLQDPWRELKAFLHLPEACEFPDGFIPKGWNISSNDEKDLEKIVRVSGDGFYHYKDGSQRRGIRHYAANRYFIIKCDPSNFTEFKSSWHNVALLSAKPTWGEYRQHAMFPGVWDENGVSLQHTKDIKWRKK